MLLRTISCSAFRYVARIFYESAQPARIILQWPYHHVCVELRPISRHAPTIILKPPLFQRQVEFFGWFPNRDLVRLIEHRKMLADDFYRAKTLDSLGAAIPAGHPSFRVRHDDCVVADV